MMEPILVLELPATLSCFAGLRVPDARPGVGSAAAMTAGLAGLLISCPRPPHRPETSAGMYMAGIGINLAFIAAMVAWGRRGPAGRGRGASDSGASGRPCPRWRRGARSG